MPADRAEEKYARQVITDIVVEEMLHMTLACSELPLSVASAV
jgi:hypothetical protein